MSGHFSQLESPRGPSGDLRHRYPPALSLVFDPSGVNELWEVHTVVIFERLSVVFQMNTDIKSLWYDLEACVSIYFLNGPLLILQMLVSFVHEINRMQLGSFFSLGILEFSKDYFPKKISAGGWSGKGPVVAKFGACPVQIDRTSRLTIVSPAVPFVKLLDLSLKFDHLEVAYR